MRVLVIDDDADIRLVCQFSLERVGKFKTITASSGSHGLEIALKEMPDVILMDMMMPGMDGVATLGAIKKSPQLAHIPVMFLTAKVQRNEVEQYLKAGAVGVIQKPFDPLELPAEVMRLIGSSGLPN